MGYVAGGLGSARINDSIESQNAVWSSQKTSEEIQEKQNQTDENLKTNDKTIVGAINELKESGGGGNADKVELTQAEYDELSEEEKHNGKLYFITDGGSDSLFKIREVTLISNAEITTQTEYNSNGTTIPHAVVPAETGYTPIAITNVRAWGYYGSRITLYAWFNNSENTQIAFSAFNAWSNAEYQARVNGSAWVLYVKNTSA